MKICAMSDMHSYLKPVPDCDLLLLAGDYLFTQKGDMAAQVRWVYRKFLPWLQRIPSSTMVCMVAGNHDHIFETGKHLLPQFPSNVYYLENSSVTILGLKVWGSPDTIEFYDWSFNKSEKQLATQWSQIPLDTDIFLTHQPPYGYGDYTFGGYKHVGSPSLSKRIFQIQPTLCVVGHIHEGRGRYRIGDSTIVNASMVTERYLPDYSPIMIEVNPDTKQVLKVTDEGREMRIANET